jgi:hypothetical protein
MLRKRFIVAGEAAELDDALYPSTFRGIAEISRRRQIALMEIPAAAHAVNEIESRVDPTHGGCERNAVEYIADDNMRALMPWPSLQPRRVAHHAADSVSRVEQSGRETAADIARRSGNQELR